MNLLKRASRHGQLTARSMFGAARGKTPPFLILYINSICNQTCEHCLYWRNLNRRDDLTFEEMEALSQELDSIENLNLSGGEPFLRPDFGQICRTFIRNNGVKQIYVPTNGSFAQRTVDAITEALREPGLRYFVVEFSLDGMPEFHDVFRGMKDAFARSMETYDALAELQKSDPRLRLHGISTVTSTNVDEIRRLSQHLLERCPAMEHHAIGMIRGDRKNPSLEGPELAAYRELVAEIAGVWASRNDQRFGGVVDPMVQWAKTLAAEEKRQIVPCRAGHSTGVVFSNGDVSFCEQHTPLGNLRQNRFREIWFGEQAEALRRSIEARECWCTNEINLWPSLVYEPLSLARGLTGAFRILG